MDTLGSAYQKYIRQSPRKLRLLADMVRGKGVEQALSELMFTPKKAARLLRAVIIQAKANALGQITDKQRPLWLTDIQIEEGPKLKRWNPVSRGRAHPILKRMSHIKVVVSGKATPAKVEQKGS